MFEEVIRKKTEDLLRRADPLQVYPADSAVIYQAQAWIIEAVNLIEVAIPVESNAYRRKIVRIEEDEDNYPTLKVGPIAELLRSFLPDLEAGLVVSFGNRVRAETFDDFLDYADIYRQEGEKHAAGVLAGVVFEDTIRRICRDQNIPDKDESLEQLINALARKGVITPLQSKGAKVAAHVRTKATHALWDEYDLDGVAATIQLTRTFLREYLGG